MCKGIKVWTSEAKADAAWCQRIYVGCKVLQVTTAAIPLYAVGGGREWEHVSSPFAYSSRKRLPEDNAQRCSAKYWLSSTPSVRQPLMIATLLWRIAAKTD